MSSRVKTATHHAQDDDSLHSATSPHTDDPSRLAAQVSAHRSRGGSRGSGRGGSGGSSQRGLLSDRELTTLESEQASGITAVQIVELFVSRGVKFSEATFRKYVQQGLVPRSRRIGRKGKHRGSLGVYPARTVRRINAIKKLMQDGHTIEEIQSRFLRYTDIIESLEEGFVAIFQRFDEDVSNPRFDTKARRSLERELAEARKSADELLHRVEAISKSVSESADDMFRSSGAAGSAEDLL